MTLRFNLDSQISTIPTVTAELLSSTVAPTLDGNRPIIFTGIGTSLHAARVAANWVTYLTDGKVRPHAVDAHDMATTLPLTADDQIVVISHRGTKIFPTATLERAAKAGASTIAVVGQTAPEQPADVTLRTCANETAGTFSVSYIASLVVLGKIAAQFDQGARSGFAQSLGELPAAAAQTINDSGAGAAAKILNQADPLLLVGFGSDLPTVQEAALKIKEGAWMWTEAMSPEFALHGTPASYHPEMAAVLVEPTSTTVDGGRTQILSKALTDLGLFAVLSCAEREDADLRFTSPSPLLRPVTSIIPLLQLTAELAALRGTNPDTMHGDREPWATVMTGLQL
ncbi:SIS domain-containing protein (plasmid) [Rhodococcus sp. USK10]|uniref:SIS domain-containing protein n=1 Tax=Rhodococcus sp. USK10 TaxID=2789739 RepID=UPI001C5F8A5E|nr:SIS domain-containing protein [Rhodococcus sp. USK10]QYB00120.1 SIS domain-containing protein [Rhodococcus sp. USK10]